MAYSDKVLEHYENPRNVGSLDKNDPDVGTGLVGAPACGDVMKLQVRIAENVVVGLKCRACGKETPAQEAPEGAKSACCQAEVDVLRGDIIEDAKFKTFGCGSAIASSSLVTEWVKGMRTDEAAQIKNSQIAEELSLPPVKIHCSVLAEDAIKAAIADWKKKREARLASPTPEPPKEPEK